MSTVPLLLDRDSTIRGSRQDLYPIIMRSAALPVARQRRARVAAADTGGFDVAAAAGLCKAPRRRDELA